MRWFQARSIKQKLMILFTLTATVALLIASFAFWTYEVIAYRVTLRREMLTTARMLADSSMAAVAFEDVEAARESMAALRADPRVETGCLYRGQTLLAAYTRVAGAVACPAVPSAEGSRFTWAHLGVSSPIVLEKQRVLVGSVYVVTDLSEMYSRLAGYGGIEALVLVLASLLALALSSRLQRLISAPILHLTAVAGQVSKAGNYLVRAQKRSDDELGTLIDRFNEMMDQIHHRDVALQMAQDKLEARVEERTRDLQDEIAVRKAIERDLVDAKVQAEESSRAKSGFLATMSHELRTPLNAIIGYSELLQEEAADRGAGFLITDLQRIRTAGAHLLALISDVLDLSKIEAGRVELHTETVPIADIIQEVVQTVEPLARKNGNRLVIEGDCDQGEVVVDAMKFRQSLLNLLSNACKFTQNGVVTLGVDRRQDRGQGWVCWRVEDTGIGIARENLSKLFQSFSQVDSSATRKYGGTGLGLSISQRFCQFMGGHITVESDPGKGSTFTIYIPDRDPSPGRSGNPAGEAAYTSLP